MNGTLSTDAVVFGGGASGLFVLDELTRAGYVALVLEAHELGSGQTIASQGIIHGGLKYSLKGWLTSSARAIREMPIVWRRCLAGEAAPNLSNTRLRAEFCHLWQTSSVSSRLSMLGARIGLNVTPWKLEAEERPPILKDCPGIVARLDEQVIEPASLLTDLNRQHRGRVLRIDIQRGLEFVRKSSGDVERIRLINPDTGQPLDILPRQVILAAGEGNAALRQKLGLPAGIMQRRPLHMVTLRGNLPTLNGHCVDGSATRVTITTTRDYSDRAIWQIGGQLAEDGVRMKEKQLLTRAREELEAVLPNVKLDGLEWSTHRVHRAEAATARQQRPDDVFAIREDNVITAWPTKLALAPLLAQRVRELAARPIRAHINESGLDDWPRPMVALPPWEVERTWFTDV